MHSTGTGRQKICVQALAVASGARRPEKGRGSIFPIMPESEPQARVWVPESGDIVELEEILQLIPGLVQQGKFGHEVSSLFDQYALLFPPTAPLPLGNSHVALLLPRCQLTLPFTTGCTDAAQGDCQGTPAQWGFFGGPHGRRG